MSKKKKRNQRLLLKNLADALNACDRAGLRPRLKHGIVFTDVGYVLVIKDRWAARALRKP
jgi:hypothetical protein